MTEAHGSWNESLLGKPFYFFFYYLPNRFTSLGTKESLERRNNVFDFKNGIAQNKIIELVEKKLAEHFSKTDGLTLVCIPASTKKSNAVRYEKFSSQVCSDLNMHNAFQHVAITREKTPSHLGGGDRAEFQLDPQYLRGKSVVLFDDVVTSGRSMREFTARLESVGAHVVACMSIARTCHPEDKPGLVHPWSRGFVEEQAEKENRLSTVSSLFKAEPAEIPAAASVGERPKTENKQNSMSSAKARRLAAWAELEEAFKSGKTVSGKVIDEVHGGFTVRINEIEAFLPYSLLDLHFVNDASSYMWETYDFKVIELERERENVVISRRAVLEAAAAENRKKLLETLKEGMLVKGVVKNLTDFGAFVDLGGIDGLIHISDLAWRRVRRPGDVVQVGQKLEAKVLKFDREKSRISLGLKQLAEDPWTGISRRCPKGKRFFGKVTKVVDYGAFVEVESGIEGLVHVSEMEQANRNVIPRKLVQKGTRVEVMVLEIDEGRRRISLGMKQCRANP